MKSSFIDAGWCVVEVKTGEVKEKKKLIDIGSGFCVGIGKDFSPELDWIDITINQLLVQTY